VFIILKAKRVSNRVKASTNPPQGHILGLLQPMGLRGALTLKQVLVLGSLLHNSSVNSIALLESLLGGRPLGNETGDPGRGAGVLVGLANAVEEVSGGDGTNGNVEAALYIVNASVSYFCVCVWQLSSALALQVRVWSRSVGELTPKPSFTGSWAA
jgi:hypothetical protein